LETVNRAFFKFLHIFIVEIKKIHIQKGESEMKKMLIVVISLFFSVNLFAVKDRNEYKISYVTAALNLPSIIEKKLKLFEQEFKQEGYSFKFPQFFSAPDQVKALVSGDIDAANAVGAIAVIAAIANGADLKVMSMYSRAPKSFFIMTKDPSIRSVKSLRGKKIAGPQGTVLHEMLGAALIREGLSFKDVKHVPMNIDLAFAAMENKSVDAVLLTGPIAQRAKASGARVIIDGEDLIGGELLIVVSGKLYRENPAFAKKIVEVHKRALEYLEANQDKAYKMAAADTKISFEQVKELASYQDYNPNFTQTDIRNLKNTMQFLHRNKMINKAVNIDKIIAE
jgi:sulfonate transport system substrate-binding protein